MAAPISGPRTSFLSIAAPAAPPAIAPSVAPTAVRRPAVADGSLLQPANTSRVTITAASWRRTPIMS